MTIRSCCEEKVLEHRDTHKRQMKTEQEHPLISWDDRETLYCSSQSMRI